MKPKTDTKGVTTIELTAQDRTRLAGAKSLAEEAACYLRGTSDGENAREVADGIAQMLAPEEEAPGD